MVVGEIGLASGLFVAALYLYSVANSFSKLEGYSPGSWPKFVLVALMICCFFIIKNSLALLRSDRTENDGVCEQDSQENKTNLWKTMLFLVLYVASVNIIGFFFPTAFFCWLLIQMLGETDRKKTAIIAVAIGLVCTLFFTTALSVPLPRGLGVFATINGLLY